MRTVAAALLLVTSLGLPRWMRAQETISGAPPPAEKPHLFVGVAGYGASPGGELDGKLVLGDSIYAYFLPRLDSAAGFLVQGGAVLKGGIWSAGYLQSSHAAFFQDRERSATLHALEVEGRGFLVRSRPVRPYLLAGFNLLWLTVKDGSLRYDAVYDARYSGLGVKVGAGVAAQVGPHVLLTAGLNYRYLALLYVKGGGKGRDVANLYNDRFGPKRNHFIQVPCPGWEIGLIFML
jgi:hypothetical protein